MAESSISFARGAPSLDIVDIEGLREAATRAFANDPAGTTAYGTSSPPSTVSSGARHDSTDGATSAICSAGIVNIADALVR